MRTNHFAVILGVAIAASGCVETDADLAEVTQAVCTGTNWATAPMPTASAWTGQLPGDVQGAAAQQVWLVEPNNNPVLPPNTFTLYLVDTVGKQVVWRATLTPKQRNVAASLAAARNGSMVFSRPPPPPPFPPIDDWMWAHAMVDDAINARTILEQ